MKEDITQDVSAKKVDEASVELSMENIYDAKLLVGTIVGLKSKIEEQEKKLAIQQEVIMTPKKVKETALDLTDAKLLIDTIVGLKSKIELQEQKIVHQQGSMTSIKDVKLIIDAVVGLKHQMDLNEKKIAGQMTIISKQYTIIEAFQKKIKSITESMDGSEELKRLQETVKNMKEYIDLYTTKPKKTVRIIERDERGLLKTITEIEEPPSKLGE
jgi:hypothetical protein